jgi:hypothetical protein
MSTEGLADKIIGRIADLMSEEDPESIVKALIASPMASPIKDWVRQKRAT